MKFDETEVFIPSANMPLAGGDDSESSNQESINQPVDSAPRPIESDPSPNADDLTPTPNPTSTIEPVIPRRSGRIGATYRDGLPNYAMLNKTGLPSHAGLGEMEEEEYEIRGMEFVMGAAIGEAEGLEPRTIEEAKARADWPMWEEAI